MHHFFRGINMSGVGEVELHKDYECYTNLKTISTPYIYTPTYPPTATTDHGILLVLHKIK